MIGTARPSLFVIATTVLIGLSLPEETLAQTQQVPAKPDRAEAPDPIWSRTLDGGATIEVIGLSIHPSGPKTWWKPDGRPLAEAPCDRSGTGINEDDPADALRHRSIVVRVTGLARDAEFSWGVREANGGSKGRAMRNRQPIPNLHETVSGFPDDSPFCTIRFAVADGPWQTLATSDGHSFAQSNANGPSFCFAEPIATKSSGTALVVTHDIQEVATRLVAVDGKGQEHAPSKTSGGGVKGFSLLSAEFDLSPDQIREYRLQTRPYKHAEIPNVSLRPAIAR